MSHTLGGEAVDWMLKPYTVSVWPAGDSHVSDERELPTVLVRQIRMLAMIPRLPSKISAPELREKLEGEGLDIDLRSVQRDLQKLKDRFSLTCDGAKPAGWSYARNARALVLPAMDPASALTLNMVEQYLAPVLPRSLLAVWQLQFNEARRILDTGKFGKWRRRVAIMPGGPERLPATTPDSVMDVVYNALLDGIQFEADYHAIGVEPARYVFNPLGLLYRDGVTYLVATREGSSHVPLFALNRMKNPKRLESPSREPAGFDLQRHLEAERTLEWPIGPPIKLRLRLSGGIVRFFEERPLSRDQKVTPVSGSEQVYLTATVQNTMSLRWWLMSFGRSVEVLAPKKLRNEMAEALLEAARQYRKRQR